MRKFVTLGLLASALVVGGISLAATKESEPAEAQDAKIIVNFNGYSKSMTDKQVLAYQNYGLSLIRSEVTTNFKVVDRYTSLLNAVVLKVPSSQVNAIRKLNFVKNVDYDTLHHIETLDGAITITRAGSSVIEENISATTMNVPSDTKKGEGILIGILDTGYLINHVVDGNVYTHETFTALPNTVSTKLSKATVDGLSGLNAKTSTDVPSLYFNNKVPFFYDYGGETDTYDDYVEGKAFPDNDVYSGISDHGLHVASMAAGNGPTYKGIASNAQLALLKVFTEYYPKQEEKKDHTQSTGCFDSAVIAALEDASKLGCDVLNMSFGSDLNDFGENTTVFNLLQQLREEGIWSNYAAGNSGKGFFSGTAYEGWTSEMIETGIMSGSANLESVMSVGASQADREFFTNAIQVNGNNIAYDDQVISSSSTIYEKDRALYDITEGGTKTEFDWVKVPNYGATADYKGLNVQGKVAVVSRGENSFGEKYLAAHKAGAIALAIINNNTGSIRMSFGDGVSPAIPVVSISYEDRDKFEDSGKLTILKDVYAANPTAGQMASFSSDGATYDLRIKPDISAPGKLVKGAVYEDYKGNLDPTATTSYDYWNGTSMATPNYTGAVALLLGEHLDDPDYWKTVNARTMSTTTILHDEKGVATSVRVQGAGMANVGNALESKIYLENEANSGKAKIEWKNNDDIKNGTLKFQLSATNEGSEPVTFTAHIDIYRPDIYVYEKAESEIDAVKNAKIQGFRNTLLRTVDKTVTIPVGTNDIDLGTVELTAEEKAAIEDYFEYACPIEGFVRFENADVTNLSVPFLGYYGDVAAASPVEPFNFEKEAGRVYPSDLVNDIATVMGFKSADYASMIAFGDFKQSTWADDEEEEEEESTSPLSNWIYNKGNFKTIADDNNRSCIEIGAKHNADDSHTLYIAQGDSVKDGEQMGNTLLIQQYVTRSVKTNTLKIYKKSDMSLVRDDHMFDTLWGDEGDPEKGEEPNYSLAKSHVLSDYLDNGIIGHRAYSIIPLWDDDKVLYPEGEYVLEFKYTTTDDVVHTKTYDFVITNAKPQINSVTDLGSFLRVRADDNAGASFVNVSGNTQESYDAKQDAEGFYIDIPKEQLKKDAFFYSTAALNKNTMPSVVRVDGEDIISVSSSEFTINHNFKVTKSTSGSTTEYTLAVTRNNSPYEMKGSMWVAIATPGGYDSNDVSVIDIDAEGNEVSASLTVTAGGVAFESAIGHYKVTLGSKTHTITAIGAQLTKDTYYIGDKFDESTISVYGIYDNGVTGPVEGTVTYSGFDSSTTGTKTLTVTVNGMSTTVSYNIIDLPALTRIEASVTKKIYEVGEEFDSSTLTVTAYYDDGSSKIVTSQATYTGFDSSEPGKIILTVRFEDEIANIELTIIEHVEPEPEPQPSKGCGGEIVTTSVILSVLSLAGVILLLVRKKKED